MAETEGFQWLKADELKRYGVINSDFHVRLILAEINEESLFSLLSSCVSSTSSI